MLGCIRFAEFPRDLAHVCEASVRGGEVGCVLLIQRKINDLEHKIKCHVCGDREKNCVITRCFHVFCRTCIDDNVKNRIRKCPACSLPFGDKDTHDIYLVA